MAKWVRAQQHGHTIYSNSFRQCSLCDEVVYLPLTYRFCPYCGAKMDKPKSENYNDFEEEE